MGNGFNEAIGAGVVGFGYYLEAVAHMHNLFDDDGLHADAIELLRDDLLLLFDLLIFQYTLLVFVLGYLLHVLAFLAREHDREKKARQHHANDGEGVAHKPGPERGSPSGELFFDGCHVSGE
jgi:hypothetical protein